MTIRLHRLLTVAYLLPAAHGFSTVTSPLSTRQKQPISLIGKKTNAFGHGDWKKVSYLTSTSTFTPDDNSYTTKNKRKLQHVQGMHPLLHKSWENIRNSVQKPTHKFVSLMAAAFIMFTVLFTPFSEALAAPSGGRMGGSFGGGGGGSRSSSSRSYSTPVRSYSNPGYSQGYSSEFIIAPSIGGGWSIREDKLIFGVFAYSIFSAFMNAKFNAFKAANNLMDGDSDTSTIGALGKGVSVAQISVALNVPDKDSPSSILTFLNRLSRTARTDSRVGVSNLVSQVALELLRQKRAAFAASSKYTHYQNGDNAQRNYSALAIQERSKFERESINKYGGVDYTQDPSVLPPSLKGDTYSSKATAVVVTIILSIDGDSTKLPVINSVSDLEKALIRIASDVKVDNCLRSAEVLWTPEDSEDTLSEREVIADYPELRSM